MVVGLAFNTVVGRIWWRGAGRRCRTGEGGHGRCRSVAVLRWCRRGWDGQVRDAAMGNAGPGQGARWITGRRSTSVLAAALIAGILTVLSPAWLEVFFRVDPDGGDGSW